MASTVRDTLQKICSFEWSIHASEWPLSQPHFSMMINAYQRISFLLCLLMLASVVAKSQEPDEPQLRIKINPTLIATGEYAVIGEYRKSSVTSYELKLGYQSFPSSLYQNIQPPNQGLVVNMGVKKFFARDMHDDTRNSWYGAYVLYKKLSHDRFWFPNKEEIASATNNVAGIKGLKGIELKWKSLLIEPYYGLSMRVKWGAKTVHCQEVAEGQECPLDGDLNESTSQFGFYPAVHLGFRVGLTRLMSK